MTTIISVDNISKRFKIPLVKKNTLLQGLIGIIKRQYDYEEFWALKDVSFEVQKGKAFGIIGRNGSGKSTLLKILARVLYPDGGSMAIGGNVSSFLELGVGFQPELSAKENVYIYSSVLGMIRRQTDKIYDQIFDFAELKRFENMKLKNFSSGMYVRLAFSTAVHIKPEILLMDEVFAVGDEHFYKKSLNKMNEMKNQGVTMVLVSHSLATIREFCSHALLLDTGRVISTGPSERVVNDYLAMLS